MHPPPEPFALSIKDTGRVMGGVSDWTVKQYVREGKLEAVKAGVRTLIVYASIKRLFLSLPPANSDRYQKTARLPESCCQESRDREGRMTIVPDGNKGTQPQAARARLCHKNESGNFRFVKSKAASEGQRFQTGSGPDGLGTELEVATHATGKIDGRKPRARRF